MPGLDSLSTYLPDALGSVQQMQQEGGLGEVRVWDNLTATCPWGDEKEETRPQAP